MWGVRGACEYPPLTHIQSNACWFLFLLFIYLRFAEAASFDKKELCRSDTSTVDIIKVEKSLGYIEPVIDLLSTVQCFFEKSRF
jgi:hypothetical protein